MIKNKIIALGITATMMLPLAACGSSSTVSTSNSENEAVATSSVLKNASNEESEEPSADILIGDIEYSVEEKVDDGDRVVLMQFTNNSPYTISNIDISYTEKTDVTSEQKEEFLNDLQEKYDFDDEDIESLEEEEISMHAESENPIPSGEKDDKIRLYYYSGSFYMNIIDHYDLVEPDIATLKYIKDGKIYTEYYDYLSDTYSVDDDVEEAFEWGKESALANLVSKPDVEVCKVDFDRDDVFWFYAYGISLDDCKAYVEDCKTKGFTVDPDVFDDSFYAYYAYDKNGNRIAVQYDDDHRSMSVDIDAADETEEASSSEDTKADAGNDTADKTETETVFNPQDVSDASIESIQTYGDYLTMFKMIIEDYFAKYEATLKDTVLYDEDSFQDLKDTMNEEYGYEEDTYGDIKDNTLVGKDGLVEYLKSYRDGLQTEIDAYAEMVQ